MTRPLRARIDLGALQHNFRLVRLAAPESRRMAVIKANAYGHGAIPVARALGEADAFALACVEEAMQLREAGVRQPLVLLEGMFSPDELDTVVKHRLEPVVHTPEQVEMLERGAVYGPLHLWLKVDTGMHRLGVPPDQVDGLRERLSMLVNKRGGSVRLMSHLACADRPEHPANEAQLAAFTGLESAGLERSLANSAALLSRPDMQFDWVRPGIMLYGASPFDPAVRRDTALRPVMELSSELIAVQRRGKGESIGYGATWTCPEAMSVGVVAAGYGDGYPRHAPNGTPVLIDGRPAPLVGRVSMDMICVDLRDHPDAGVGTPVRLWGEGLPVELIAEYAGTISYELLCNIAPRVPREYCDGES
jgi:alanine racemase